MSDQVALWSDKVLAKMIFSPLYFKATKRFTLTYYNTEQFYIVNLFKLL